MYFYNKAIYKITYGYVVYYIQIKKKLPSTFADGRNFLKYLVFKFAVFSATYAGSVYLV